MYNYKYVFNKYVLFSQYNKKCINSKYNICIYFFSSYFHYKMYKYF